MDIKCPKCGRPGHKKLKGYCTKVHYKLDKRRAPKLRIPCANCGAIQIRAPSAVLPSGNVYCKSCHKARGESHPRWSDGQFINNHGYRLVLVNGRYKREHRLIWQQANCACLLPGMNGAIHHIDFDKLNNSPDNLLLLSNAEHGRLHRYIEGNKKQRAAELLVMAAKRQYYYPAGIDAFILRMFMQKTDT